MNIVMNIVIDTTSTINSNTFILNCDKQSGGKDTHDINIASDRTVIINYLAHRRRRVIRVVHLFF